jgi:hypothetical protein
MSNIYKPNLKNIPIRYAWDKKKKEYYTCIPISQNHKQSKGWWNVVWEVDNTHSVVNLSEKAFYNGNWTYLHKQKKSRKKNKNVSSKTNATTTTTIETPQLSKYEIDRLKRIEENRKYMVSLGLDIIRDDIGMTSPQRRRQSNSKTATTAKKIPKRKVVATVPRKGWRLSRRLRGRRAVTASTSRKAEKTMLVNFEKLRHQQEKEIYQSLLSRYKKDQKLLLLSSNKNKRNNRASSRNLFLVPTGTYGFNDHTLEKKVPALGTYLWGFARGKYK